MRAHLLWMALIVGGAASCGHDVEEQTFGQGMSVICSSPTRVAGHGSSAPARAVAASIWVSAHLTNPEARELYAGLASLSPEHKALAVRTAASRAGLRQCPIADLWSPPM